MGWVLLGTIRPVIALPSGQGIPYHSLAETYLPTPRKLQFDPCSCVSFAKALTGHLGETWGNAGNIQPNTTKPQIGFLVLLNEGTYGHVAVIQSIVGDTIIIRESNYIPCKTGTRTLHISDPQIRGFRNPD
jgi:hypothetical protein